VWFGVCSVSFVSDRALRSGCCYIGLSQESPHDVASSRGYPMHGSWGLVPIMNLKSSYSLYNEHDISYSGVQNFLFEYDEYKNVAFSIYHRTAQFVLSM